MKNSMNIENRKFVKVYYQIDENREKPIRVYERESVGSKWRIVGDYIAPDIARESGLSRAASVVEIGAVTAPTEKGFFSWFEVPNMTNAFPDIVSKKNRPS